MGKATKSKKKLFSRKDQNQIFLKVETIKTTNYKQSEISDFKKFSFGKIIRDGNLVRAFIKLNYSVHKS